MGNKPGSNLTAEEKKAYKEARARTAELEKGLKEGAQQDSSINKLLLLGAGGSGKSTLFKQMTTLYGGGFSEEERREYVDIIYSNVITAIQALVNNTTQWGGVDGADGEIAAMASADVIKGLSAAGEDPVDEAVAEHIKVLWGEPAVQVAFQNSSHFQLQDSAVYYFKRLDEIAKPDYIPDVDDVLRARARTTGIVENNFTMASSRFKVFDVGGQRSERKKWMRCFEDVTAILFVGVLSEYDLVLFEDESKNRMQETLELFLTTISSDWFGETPFILFLNKRDVYEEKIKKIPLSKSLVFKDLDQEYLDQFPGGIDTYDSGIEAIKDQFMQNNKNETTIYTHVTCATDTNQMQIVFGAVKDIVIRISLGSAGLV